MNIVRRTAEPRALFGGRFPFATRLVQGLLQLSHPMANTAGGIDFRERFQMIVDDDRPVTSHEQSLQMLHNPLRRLSIPQ